MYGGTTAIRITTSRAPPTESDIFESFQSAIFFTKESGTPVPARVSKMSTRVDPCSIRSSFDDRHKRFIPSRRNVRRCVPILHWQMEFLG